jgi:uncharacterized membrane protein
MSVEANKKEKSRRKMRRYVLWSIIAIAAAAIVSFALYSVVQDYLFPFAALPVFAVLVFLLTLFWEDAYYSGKEMNQGVAAEETNG